MDKLCIDSIRALSMDAVQQANSGLSGTPMAPASVAHTPWQRFLRFDPDDLPWINRDRFVRSKAMRALTRYKTYAATCLGFGPRFQHSSGPAYKSGPNTGVFLQITYDDCFDIGGPGHSYGFGVVEGGPGARRSRGVCGARASGAARSSQGRRCGAPRTGPRDGCRARVA